MSLKEYQEPLKPTDVADQEAQPVIQTGVPVTGQVMPNQGMPYYSGPMAHQQPMQGSTAGMTAYPPQMGQNPNMMMAAGGQQWQPNPNMMVQGGQYLQPNQGTNFHNPGTGVMNMAGQVLPSINPQKLSNDNFTMTQEITGPLTNGNVCMLIIFYIGYLFLNIMIPSDVIFVLIMPTIMFTLLSVCMLYGYLATPKSTKIVSDKLDDSITFLYQMPYERFCITKKRKMSDLIDLRSQEVTSQSKNGYVRKMGDRLYFIFKNREDQVVFFVRHDCNQLMNELDIFCLNGQARRDTDYQKVDMGAAISETKNICYIALGAVLLIYGLTFAVVQFVFKAGMKQY